MSCLHGLKRAAVLAAAVGASACALAYEDELISTPSDSVARIDRADGATVYVFTGASGETTVTPQNSLSVVEYLVVGGGGSGGNTIGGGGGGGGVVASPDGFFVAVDSPLTLSVGAGGPVTSIAGNNWKKGNNGSPSSLSLPGLDAVIAYGGGGGGGWNDFHAVTFSDAAPYANGGGGASTNGKGGQGLFFNGGNGLSISGNDRAPGGGAGAAGNGENGQSTKVAGNGGPGVLSSITGEELDYGAGGGGGGGNNITSAYAGGPSAGDGGPRNANKPGTPGLDGRGGGGGGGGYNPATSGGKGGDGTVILAVRPASLMVANTFCGYAGATISDTIQAISLPQMDAGDSYLLSMASDSASLPATGWTAYDPDAAFPTFTFASGTAFGEVTVYCHVRRAAGGDIETSSDSILYVDPATASLPVAKAKPASVVVDVSGADVPLTVDMVDDGSSDNDYGIYGMGVSPSAVSGDDIVTLSVTNNLGLVSTATARISASKFASFGGALKIWLDADDFSKYPTDTQVSGWTDKASGVAFSQATAKNQPVVLNDGLNGKTVLKFTRPAANQAQFLQTTGSDIVYKLFNSTNTAFAVARATSGGGDNSTQKATYIFSRPGNHSGMTFEGYPNATTATATRWVGQGATTKAAMVVSTPYTQGEWITLSRVIRGNETVAPVEIDVSVNNEPAASASNTAWSLYTHGTTNGKIMRIGCANNNSNYSGGLSGEIAEILVYDRELTAEEQAVVSQILNEKWGFLKLSVENILTGSRLYTATNEVAVICADMYDDATEYQLSTVSDANSLDDGSWVSVDTPVPETFAFPADTPEGDVAIYLWTRNALGDVRAISTSITYTKTPPTVVIADPALDIDSVKGYELDVDQIDTGTTDPTGIFSRSIEPSFVYGATDVVFTVMNNAGTIACATSHVTVANALDLHVETDGSDELGDGTAAKPFATITHALSVANNSPSASQRTVYVGEGTFSPESGETFPLVVSNNVAIAGVGMGRTIIDPDHTERALFMATASADSRVGDLSLRRSDIRALQFAGAWGGLVENVEISDVSNGNAIIHYSSNSSRNLVFSGLVVTNVASSAQRFATFLGTGSCTLTNCLFRDISVPAGASQANGNFHFANANGVTQNGWPCTIVDCEFANVTSPGNGQQEGGFFLFGQIASGNHLIERCKFHDMAFTTKGDQLVCGNRSVVRVRNSLFHHISMKTNASGFSCMIGGFRGHTYTYNCTFDQLTGPLAVFRPSNEGNHYAYVYNSSVSSCNSLAANFGSNVYLYNVNIYDTADGVGYSALNSTGVTSFAPYYKNADDGDYRLLQISQLVDLGDNANAAGDTDMNGTPRIVDGNGDGEAVVDLGATEFSADAQVAHFAFGALQVGIISGKTATIPVWIEPPVALGPVTATVSYPTNTSGTATLSFPTGTETNMLVIAADAAFDVPDYTLLPLTVSDESGAVDSGSVGLLYASAEVVVPNYKPRVFLRPGETAELALQTPGPEFAAPCDIEIGVIPQQGSGDGAISWNGSLPSGFAAGDVSANGALLLTAGTQPGSSKVSLEVGDGFVFAENGETTLDVELVTFESPLYVSPEGSDETGLGTAESPLRTLTYAVTHLVAGETLRLLPGVYGPTDAEVFPVTVPPGIAIVGVRGETGTADDTSIIDPDGNSGAFFLGTLGSNPGTVAGGALRSLVIRNAKGTTVRARYWGGEIADCKICDIDPTGAFVEPNNANSGTCGVYALGVNGGITFDGVEICDIEMKVPHIIYVASGSGATTITNCWFHDIATASNYTVPASNGPFDSRIALTVADTVAERLSIAGASTQGGGVFFSAKVAMTFLRCTFRDIDLVGQRDFTLISVTDASSDLVANCLFHDVRSTVGSALFGGFRSPVYVRNCTMDNVCGVSQSFNTVDKRWVYNSTVSNCDKFNISSAVGSFVVQNSNLYNAGEGYGYTTNSSSNVYSFDPMFKDAANGDYHFRSNSPLVDKGDNSLVVAAMGSFDLGFGERILDGDWDDVAVVDLGCYELDPPPFGTLFMLK